MLSQSSSASPTSMWESCEVAARKCVVFTSGIEVRNLNCRPISCVRFLTLSALPPSRLRPLPTTSELFESSMSASSSSALSNASAAEDMSAAETALVAEERLMLQPGSSLMLTRTLKALRSLGSARAMTLVTAGRWLAGVQLWMEAEGSAVERSSSMHCLIQKCGPMASQFWLQTMYMRRSGSRRSMLSSNTSKNLARMTGCVHRSPARKAASSLGLSSVGLSASSRYTKLMSSRNWALSSASSGNLFSTYVIILTRSMDFSLMLGPWLMILTSLFFIQSSSILVMAFMTLTSGDFSMRPTRMVPTKALRMSCPMTATRFLTRSRLRIRSSLAAAVFSCVVGLRCSRCILCRTCMLRSKVRDKMKVTIRKSLK